MFQFIKKLLKNLKDKIALREITDKDYTRVAKALKIEKAALIAIASVESRGKGFLPSGVVKVLFEPHIFSRYTKSRFDKTHPNLSSKKWNRLLYKKGGTQHTKLNKAAKLAPAAARMACSWGKFQIMGFNWLLCGYPSINDFVRDMCISEKYHLKALASFIKNQPNMLEALRAKNFVKFARLYNGPQYRKNKYHTKLATAYLRAKKKEK